MPSVQEIRQRLRSQRIESLSSRIGPLLAVAPEQSAADELADALLGTGLCDDVIGLSQGRWLERQRGDDPWWRGICRDAIRLQPLPGR